MRKRFRVLLFAALAAAFIVPVGFALSLESSSSSQTARLQRLPVPAAAVSTSASASVTSSVIVSGAIDQSAAIAHPIPDAAKLLLVGTMLFGLAAALRKTI